MFDPSKLDLSDVDTSKAIPATKQEIRAYTNAIRDAVGDALDKLPPNFFEDMLMEYAENEEEWLRENWPDHPALAILNEHRQRKQMGLE